MGSGFSNTQKGWDGGLDSVIPRKGGMGSGFTNPQEGGGWDLDSVIPRKGGMEVWI